MRILLPLVLIASVSVFSLFAFIIGFNLAFENPEQSLKAYEELEVHGEQDLDVDRLAAKDEIPSSVLFNIYYKLSKSSKYAFGEGSYLVAYKRHTLRNGLEKFSLYFHIIMGSIVLFAGGFQFWTWFRRKYRKAHRILGLMYVVSIISMGIAILSYLLHAGIYNTHEGYIGYWGLHLLNMTTVLPVFISLFYLYKKDFGKHLGWMSLSFGAILTAPVQRSSWSFLATLNLNQTHAVINSVVDTYLFASCYFFGYMLFCINRGQSPLKKNISEKTEYSKSIKGIVYVISLLGAYTIVHHFVFSNGLSDSADAQNVLSDLVINMEYETLFSGGGLAILYGLATAFALILTACLFFKESSSPLLVYTVVGLVSAIGFIEILWGYNIGLPIIKYSVGGSHYFFYGLCHLFFVFLIILGKNKYVHFYKEWQLSIWLMLLTVPLWYWVVYFHSLVSTSIDPVFIEQNHVHQFMVGLAPAAIFIVMIIIAIYSKNTTNRIVH